MSNETTPAVLTMAKLQELCGVAREAFGPSAIIAGGAPRDILSCRPVKDIDIFVNLSMLPLYDQGDCPFAESLARRTFQDCAIALHRLLRCAGKPTYPSSAEYKELDLVELEARGLPTIQVVGVKGDPVDDVHNYDFTISKVFVTPGGHFEHAEAQIDRTFWRIGYTPSSRDTVDAHARERSRKRLARLKEKYSGWEFYNCAALEGA